MTSILKVSTIQDPTNSNTAISIDANGVVTKGTGGQLPAFLAYPSSNWSTSVGQYNVVNESNLIYASVHYNYGSHYNTSTGRFVAPVTGLYHFWANMAMNSNSNTYSYMSAEIHYWSANGNTLNTRWIGGWGNKQTSNTVYDRHYYSIAIPLTAGDGVSAGYEMATASVPVLGGGSGNYTSFGGYLIG
jgi:hypothetical protein